MLSYDLGCSLLRGRRQLPALALDRGTGSSHLMRLALQHRELMAAPQPVAGQGACLSAVFLVHYCCSGLSAAFPVHYCCGVLSTAFMLLSSGDYYVLSCLSTKQGCKAMHSKAMLPSIFRHVSMLGSLLKEHCLVLWCVYPQAAGLAVAHDQSLLRYVNHCSSCAYPVCIAGCMFPACIARCMYACVHVYKYACMYMHVCMCAMGVQPECGSVQGMQWMCSRHVWRRQHCCRAQCRP